MEKTDPTYQKLVEQGVDLGETFLRQVVEEAKGDGDIAKGMVVMQAAAAHIIASVAFNGFIQNGEVIEGYVDGVASTIKRWAYDLKEQEERGEIERVHAGGESQKCDA